MNTIFMEVKDMTNSELRIEMKSLSDEYEVKKNKIRSLLSEMHELDVRYNKIETELNKRSKY